MLLLSQQHRICFAAGQLIFGQLRMLAGLEDLTSCMFARHASISDGSILHV